MWLRIGLPNMQGLKKHGSTCHVLINQYKIPHMHSQLSLSLSLSLSYIHIFMDHFQLEKNVRSRGNLIVDRKHIHQDPDNNKKCILFQSTSAITVTLYATQTQILDHHQIAQLLLA